MKDYELYEAIGDIREDYIQEARGTGGRKRSRGWIRWGAAAACLCVVLMGTVVIRMLGWGTAAKSGVLTITAYAALWEEPRTMEEGIQLPLDYQWSPAMSSIPGLPLKLSYSGDGPVTFDVSADGGSLLLWSDSKITEVGASFQAGNDITLYWTSYFQHNDPQTGESCLETFSGEKTYVDILVRQGEAIVGYAVVEIASDGGTVPLYAATLLKMEGFPGKNGTPSEAEVRAKMEEIKEEARSAA